MVKVHKPTTLQKAFEVSINEEIAFEAMIKKYKAVSKARASMTSFVSGGRGQKHMNSQPIGEYVAKKPTAADSNNSTFKKISPNEFQYRKIIIFASNVEINLFLATLARTRGST